MNEQIKVAFFDAKPYDIQSFNGINPDFNYKIKYFSQHLDIDSAPLTKGYDVVCCFVNDKIDKEVIPLIINNGVKLIAMRCAGYNNVDLKAAYRNIHVVRVPAYSPFAVAEHAVALMLSLNRKTHRAYFRTHDNNFNIHGLLGFDMFGKTAGIIGTGKIGKILINILKGFGMKILAYDMYPDAAFEKETGIEYTTLERIYSESDIISLHCPLTRDSYHMINKQTFAMMKETVMIINTSRGALIDTRDLVEALKDKKIGYAGLDVYEEESEYFFEDFSGEVISDDVLARLLTFPNVLVTSHQAFFTKEAIHNIADTTLKNINDFFSHDTLPNEICYKCGSEHCNKKITGKCF